MGHDLRFAWRMIFSHRWFSAAVVATLALGIGVNTMVFTLVDAVLLKPVAVPGGSRLVAISHQNLTQGDGSMRLSLPALRDYRSQASSLEALEATRGEDGVLSERGNPPQSYSMQRASSGIFDMMHIPPVLGRGFLPEDDKPGAPPVLLLGHGVWKERYGSSPAVIGRVVHVNERRERSHHLPAHAGRCWIRAAGCLRQCCQHDAQPRSRASKRDVHPHRTRSPAMASGPATAHRERPAQRARRPAWARPSYTRRPLVR